MTVKTIYPEPHLLFVFSDGDGTSWLRIQARDGAVQVWELTDERTARLMRDLATDLGDRIKLRKRPQ